MAAIIESHRLHHIGPQRPALRLVPTSGGRPVDVTVSGLGFTTGHLVAAVVGLVLALMLALAIGNGALSSLAPAPASATAPASSSAAPTTVRVRPGDTLWSIAHRLQPTGDVRPLVDRLLAANGSAPLQPGQQVVVPA